MKAPITMSFTGELLKDMKFNNKVPKNALMALKNKAEEICSRPTLKVIDRKVHADSGNIHDYASIGTYWWPNPDTKDGLPYVRRDGITNPLAKDPVSYQTLCENILNLALAAYHFDEEKYAKAAVAAIYDWFLNPETYMTPNAEYSQFIPGICKGRGIGIIDFRYTYCIFDGVAILEALNMIDKATVGALKAWFYEFGNWLITSESGLEEEAEKNNHGTWYDVIVMSIAVFTNRPNLFNKILTTTYKRRFADEVNLDGSQPLELERTMGMIYSLANISALTILINIASTQGHPELMRYDEEYGTSIIKKAIDYVYPYAINLESFPYQEIKPELVPLRMAEILFWIDARYPEEDYAKKAQALLSDDGQLWLTKPFI